MAYSSLVPELFGSTDEFGADFAIKAVKNFNPHHGEGGRFASSDSIAAEPTTPCPRPCNDGHGDSRVGVPADQVPPPPPIGRLPNLTAHERRAESEFADMYEKDPNGVARTYREGVLATTKPGDPPTFETDGAKNLSPVWTNPDLNTQCVNRATLNTALHGTANAIAKRAFLEHLDTLKPGDNVLVTCGGCGAGKGYALKNVPEALAAKGRSKAVWDSAGDQNSSENPWVQRECERRGLTATYVHVTADPIKHWGDPQMGVVARASNPKDGRMVDAKVFADSYTRGTENMRNFYNDNATNPSAKFVFLDARGHKPTLVNSMPRTNLPSTRELSDFASSVAAISGAPPHIVRGATVGERIWAGVHNANPNHDEQGRFAGASLKAINDDPKSHSHDDINTAINGLRGLPKQTVRAALEHAFGAERGADMARGSKHGAIDKAHLALVDLKQAAEATPHAAVEKALQTFPKGARIRLADLRGKVPGHQHSEVTEALWGLAGQGKVSMYRLDDPREVQQRDRDAAVKTSTGEEKHIVYYGKGGS